MEDIVYYVDILEGDDVDKYIPDMVTSALALEGQICDSDIIEAIVNNRLADIDYKGTNGKPLTAYEVNLITNIYYAVLQTAEFIKRGMFKMDFAIVTSITGQLLREETIEGIHVPTLYATNLQGFGYTVQAVLNKYKRVTRVVMPKDTEGLNPVELKEWKKFCSCFENFKNLCRDFAGSQWFSYGNNMIAYLVGAGYFQKETGKLLLFREVDNQEDAIRLRDAFSIGAYEYE